MADTKDLRALIERANAQLPNINTPMMGGDNLAICLCSFFDDGDRETEDDTGWSQKARDGYEEVIAAIRKHYADALASLLDAEPVAWRAAWVKAPAGWLLYNAKPDAGPDYVVEPLYRAPVPAQAPDGWRPTTEDFGRASYAFDSSDPDLGTYVRLQLAFAALRAAAPGKGNTPEDAQ